MPYFLPAYNDPIDSLIGDFQSGSITTIYGNASSGKTTSCLLATIACAKKGGKIIYVDTEGSFSPERLKQMYFGDVNEIIEKIFLLTPKSFEEQDETILKLHKLCDNKTIKLVIIDTISNHYRAILSDGPKEINKKMAEQLANIMRIARDFDKVVIMTNQASARLNERDGIRMVGGKMIEKMSRCIIELKKTDSKRVATLIKYKSDTEKENPNIGKKVLFEIKEKGLFLIQ
jgi:DNA repair protein RadB